MDRRRRQWFYTWREWYIGHKLTMDIAKGLSIYQHLCYACIAHLYPKASEEEEEGKISLIVRCL